MESGIIKIPQNNLQSRTYQRIQINRLMPYLGIYAHQYTIKEMNKIIVKSLSPKAIQKYVE